MIEKTQAWYQLQLQRLRAQGLRQRVKAGIKKILIVWHAQLQKRPRTKSVALHILRVTRLSHLIKRLIAPESRRQKIQLSARALEIRQELKGVIKQLEKTR